MTINAKCCEWRSHRIRSFKIINSMSRSERSNGLGEALVLTPFVRELVYSSIGDSQEGFVV